MKYGNLSRLFVLLDSIGTSREVLESDRKTLQINDANIGRLSIVKYVVRKIIQKIKSKQTN